MISLDVDAVRAFLLVAEFESFTKAAHYLDTTQGVVSVKLKRLEERLGYRLLDRTPRRVGLSSEGKVFIDAASEFIAAHDRALRGPTLRHARLVLGASYHLVDRELALLLSALRQYDPALAIEVRVGHSRQMLDDLGSGRLDAVIVPRVEGRSDGYTIMRERLGWYATPEWTHEPGTPLRLASLPATSSTRAMALRSLDEATIPWIEAFVGETASAVYAAVSAGLGVAALMCRIAPAGAEEVSGRCNLPLLPEMEVVLYTGSVDERVKHALCTAAGMCSSHAEQGGSFDSPVAAARRVESVAM
ncbi:LysR family transcriptional regulator [Paraburkholderia sp. Se-20369]|nr:LysR family transcriptional regulator [Paraburkholderia sp. Se-20369]